MDRPCSGIGGVVRYRGQNEYWLNPDAVAQTYQGLGRTDDAIGVLRADFVRRPTVESYCGLRHFAGTIDQSEVERTWAYDHARQLAESDQLGRGAVLVQLCICDGDLDAAWDAADRYGPGGAWQELAVKGADARPVAAADLYRPQLERDLVHANTRLYPGIATRLATMRELYEKGDCSAEFASFIAQIREDYGRRPSLMKALAAKGLGRAAQVEVLPRSSRSPVQESAHQRCHANIFGQLGSLGQILGHLAIRVGGDGRDDALPMLQRSAVDRRKDSFDAPLLDGIVWSHVQIAKLEFRHVHSPSVTSHLQSRGTAALRDPSPSMAREVPCSPVAGLSHENLSGAAH